MHLWIEFCFLLIKCFYLLTVFMWIQNHLGNISWEVQNVVDLDPNPLGSKLFYWIRIQDRITDLEPDLDPCLSLAWKNIDAVVLLLPTKPNLTKGMLEEESKQRQLKAYVCVHLQKCVNARHLQTDQASGKTMVYRPTPFSQQKSTYGQEGY